MILEELTISGFRVFRRPATLHFPAAPGLYALTGENRVEPQLGSNGSGKSSVLDALCWVLYGRTARNLRGPDVAHWEGGSPVGEAVFRAEDKDRTMRFRFRRTAKPARVQLQAGDEPAVVVEQSDIDRLLRLDHAGFLATCLMGQFNQFFFDLSPAEKLAVFSDAMGLAVWERAAQRASFASGQADEQARALEQAVAELDGRIKALREQEAAEREAADHFEKNRRTALSLAKEAWKHAEARRQTCEQARQDARGSVDYINARLARRAKRIEEADAAHHVALEAWEEARREVERLRAQHEQAAKELKQAKAGVCPVCRRPWAGSAKEASGIKAAAEALAARCLQAEDEAARRYEATVEAKKERSALLEAQQNRYMAASTAAREEGEAASRLAQAKAREESLRQEYRRLSDGDNPHAKRAKALQQARRSAAVDRYVRETQLKKVRQAKADADFWVKEFRLLRLWLVEEALAQLEVETENALRALGLPGWRVSFEIEKTTKAGGLTRGFHVLIASPASERPVRWECWSGGETQRLRIAGACGLADLLRARTGTPLAAEFWDEPTHHVNAEGIEDLLAFFVDRAADRRRPVWLIDHRAPESGVFEAEWKVVKTAKGATITEA